MSTVLVAQTDSGYDYVLPEDSTHESRKRPRVSLPIKTKKNPGSYYYIPSYVNRDKITDRNGNYLEDETVNEVNKTSVNVELGSSAMTDFKGNSAITTYVAPHIRHQLDEDLAVSGGVIMSKTFLNGWKDYSLDGSSLPGSFVSTTLYGRLEYSLNDRMTIYGSVYKNISTLPSNYAYLNQSNGFGYALGMEYKISERSFLQIQVQRSSGYNPFQPYGTNYGFGTRPIGYFP